MMLRPPLLKPINETQPYGQTGEVMQIDTPVFPASDVPQLAELEACKPRKQTDFGEGDASLGVQPMGGGQRFAKLAGNSAWPEAGWFDAQRGPRAALAHATGTVLGLGGCYSRTLQPILQP